jgi:predicted nucleic acid-binding protein
MSLAFFDTNILVYTDSASDSQKQKQASAIFREHFANRTAVLSLQVLQEYFAAVTRKLGVPADVAQRRVQNFSLAKIVRFKAADIIAAIELHRLSQVSFWEALIVHAARISGANVLYSEDFQNGAVLGGVRVVNPFVT